LRQEHHGIAFDREEFGLAMAGIDEALKLLFAKARQAGFGKCLRVQLFAGAPRPQSAGWLRFPSQQSSAQNSAKFGSADQQISRSANHRQTAVFS
jgi:hypothetical protein